MQRLGLLVSCLAVLSAGRFLLGEVRGFADRDARAELRPELDRSLRRWAAELPETAVIRFDAADSPTATRRLVHLRFRLARRRVVRTGDAEFRIVETPEVAEPNWEPLDELEEGLWLCRRRP